MDKSPNQVLALANNLIYFAQLAYVKMWIHIVWTIKNRETFLKKEVRKAVFDHIRENAAAEEIYIEHQETHDQKKTSREAYEQLKRMNSL